MGYGSFTVDGQKQHVLRPGWGRVLGMIGRGRRPWWHDSGKGTRRVLSGGGSGFGLEVAGLLVMVESPPVAGGRRRARAAALDLQISGSDV